MHSLVGQHKDNQVNLNIKTYQNKTTDLKNFPFNKYRSIDLIDRNQNIYC